MKIVFVFDNMRYGGIQRVGISHIKLLKEAGHDIDAIVLSRHTEDIVNELASCVDNIYYTEFPRHLTPEFYHILSERYSWGKFIFPIAYSAISILDQILKPFAPNRNKYDLAIAFSGHFNDLNYVARNFVKSKRKACWLHGAQYDYYIISRGFAFLYARIKNLVVLSNTCDISCQKIEKRFGLNLTKLYNPVKASDKTPDLDKINSLRRSYGDYLLFVGRLANDKDPETIIHAVQCLRDKYNIDKHLVIVGDGPKKAGLIRLVQNLNLTEWVHFEGMRHDVENYYRSAFLFVHSSPLEGLPTTILEAMSHRLVVVATDSMPGVREILRNNEYGLVCPVGDFEAMAKCIVQLTGSSDLYRQYQEAGLKRIRDFDPDIIKNQLSGILQVWMDAE